MCDDSNSDVIVIILKLNVGEVGHSDGEKKGL